MPKVVRRRSSRTKRCTGSCAKPAGKVRKYRDYVFRNLDSVMVDSEFFAHRLKEHRRLLEGMTLLVVQAESLGYDDLIPAILALKMAICRRLAAKRERRKKFRRSLAERGKRI